MTELPANYNALEWHERKAVRLEYIKQQGGRCYYCLEPLSGPPAERVTSKKINARLFPQSFFRHPVHLHHNHATGLTIGAVHNHCNAVLWQYHGK